MSDDDPAPWSLARGSYTRRDGSRGSWAGFCDETGCLVVLDEPRGDAWDEDDDDDR